MTTVLQTYPCSASGEALQGANFDHELQGADSARNTSGAFHILRSRASVHHVFLFLPLFLTEKLLQETGFHLGQIQRRRREAETSCPPQISQVYCCYGINRSSLMLGHSAVVEITTSRPICVELFKDYRELGWCEC